MLESLARLKPGAPRRVHLLLAAMTWTAVGMGLLALGIRWSNADGAAPRSWVVTLALAAGALKAWFVLRGAARRVASRIEDRGDGRCAGGFFSWRTWLFVACMSVAGRLLRLVGLPPALVGFIYLAVGTALFIGSVWLWHAWQVGAHRNEISSR